MRLRKIIKELWFPTLITGGIYCGITGQAPFMGRKIDEILASIDPFLLSWATYPAVLSLFFGLALAWLIYVVFRLIKWRGRENALNRLGELRESGAHFRNDLTKRTPTKEDRKKIRQIEKEIYENMARVSKPEVGHLRTIDVFDVTKFPFNIQSDQQLLHFSERLRRLDQLIIKHTPAG